MSTVRVGTPVRFLVMFAVLAAVSCRLPVMPPVTEGGRVSSVEVRFGTTGTARALTDPLVAGVAVEVRNADGQVTGSGALAPKDGSWGGAVSVSQAGTAVFTARAADSLGADLYYGTTETVLTGSGDQVTIPVVSLGLIRWSEGFEDPTLEAGWILGGTDPANALLDDQVSYDGTASLRFDSLSLYNNETVILSRTLELTAASCLQFKYRTDIGGDPVQTYFRFYVDGVQDLSAAGLDKPWLSHSAVIGAGTHTVEWRVEKYINSYYPTRTNSVWLDGITLCDDQAAYVEFDPPGPQWSVVSQPLVSYSAAAYRADCSAMEGVEPTLSVFPGSGDGSLDGSGLFTGSTPGKCVVKAVSGSLTAYSEAMEVLPADYLDLPVDFAGTMYAGKAAGGNGSPLLAADADIVVSSPTVQYFDADGFFTLKGAVTYTGDLQYALVYVTKDSDTTCYFVRGSFGERIWLRFGTGQYIVTVHKCQLTTNNLDYEGDFGNYTYWSPAYRFVVNNTRAEDGRFRYPSFFLQSDDLRIRNLASSLAFDLTGAEVVQKAIHDRVVALLFYDYDSIPDNQRKKQDAVTVLLNGMGVCEGYTSLFGALARAAGLTVKAASGTVTSGGGHAWNLVDNGAGELMIDTTWDDPGPNDADPTNIRWSYFLCATTGVDNDHTWLDDRAYRALRAFDPTAYGWPEGTY